ncbi:MAG: hypothetical protein J5777_08210 [Clostridiales bacterium]|nr:hypothetical protein [Clostridiales bacterium]
MSAQNNIQPTVVSAKKINVVLGIIHLLVVAIILGVNLYFRFTDVHKGDGYEYVDGVIVKREEKYSYIGRNRTSDTWITVRYTPKETGKQREYLGTDFSYGFLYTGTVLRVYYKMDGLHPRDVFLAKYDWLVRDYLPADKSYNIPLFIAGALLMIGIYYFIDDNKAKNKDKIITGKTTLEQQGFAVDPNTGKIYDEELHSYSRFINRKRGWKRFWIAGSLFCTFFMFMGIMMLVTTLREYAGDRDSIIAGSIFSGFIMILGIGFVPLIITTIMRQSRKQRMFIKAFLDDPATVTYSERKEAARTLWKLVNHYMEKEMPWSRFKLEYSRFWLEKYKDKLEKYM